MAEDRKDAIHTMKTDAEDLLKKEKSSFLELFASQTQKPIEYKRPQTSSPTTTIVTAVVLVLALGALGFVGYTYFLRADTGIKPPLNTWQAPRPIINAEETSLIQMRVGDRTGLLQELTRARVITMPEGAYRYVPLVVADINVEPHNASLAELFGALAINPPSDLLSNLTGRWNIYTRGKNDVVFVFEVADRIKTQGSLLRWEDAMPSDFIFLVANAEPGTYEFKDGIVKNIDTRVARLSQTRDAAVAWAIALGKYLIITTSEESLVSTIERLIAQPNIE